MEIQGFDVHSLNNGAHFLFIRNVLDRAESDRKIAGKLSAQVSALRTAMEAEDEALKISQKSLLTDEISLADQQRDAQYIILKKIVNGYRGIPLEPLSHAEKVLNQLLKDYAINPKAQLDKETGLLINLIGDLETKYATEAAALGLTAIVAQLKEANEKVRQFTSERTDERTAKVAGAMKAARAECDEAFRTLVRFVNAYALIEGDADYAGFIAYMNTEIKHYKEQVLGQTAAPSQPSPQAQEDDAEGGNADDGGNGDDGGNADDGGNGGFDPSQGFVGE